MKWPTKKEKQTMIKEAKTQVGKVVTPTELATVLLPIPLDKLHLAATGGTTGSWTGNWWDGDTWSD